MEHRGQIIEKVIRTRISISEFSRRLNVSRRTIYNWFKNSDLSFTIIEEIGLALDYDFSKEFPQLASKKNDQAGLTRTDALFWKQKYADLLEVHQAFVRNNINMGIQNRV